MDIIIPGELIELRSEQSKISQDFLKIQDTLYAVSRKAGIIYCKKRDDVTNIGLTTCSEKYYAKKDDRVIGVITKKGGENYVVDIGAEKEAILGVQEFDGASKRSKPNLEVGSLLYLRIVNVHKYLPIKQTCKCPSNKKDWTSGDAVYGELKEGLEVSVSNVFIKRLLNDSTIFDALKKYITFEVALGVNNKVWVSTQNIQNQILQKNFLKQASKMSLEEALAKIAEISTAFIVSGN